MPCYRPRALTVAILALAAACAPDQGPSAPESPRAPPDLAGSAFRLTIDVASGRVEVAAPRPAASTAAAGPSFSLIGNDGVEFRGTGTNGSISCSWTNIPTNSKQKRGTFDFTLTNRLQFTDLVTPTSFPRPPQGTTGILVFPYQVPDDDVLFEAQEVVLGPADRGIGQHPRGLLERRRRDERLGRETRLHPARSPAPSAASGARFRRRGLFRSVLNGVLSGASKPAAIVARGCTALKRWRSGEP
jgi:hypothetical protein